MTFELLEIIFRIMVLKIRLFFYYTDILELFEIIRKLRTIYVIVNCGRGIISERGNFDGFKNEENW